MRFFFVLLFSLSASITWADVRYDASKGNFPQDQGFAYSGDVNPDTGTNPSPTVSGGILSEDTTAGNQYWYANDTSINLSGHLVLQAVLNIISSNYIANIGTGTREGYYLEVVDSTGNVFSVGLADAGYSINTIGTPNAPLTPYPISVVGSFHTYRLEVNNFVATFFIDGTQVAGGIGPNNFGNPGGPTVYFGAAAGLARNVTQLKSFCYGEDTSACASSSCVTSITPSGASYFAMGGLGGFTVNAPTQCDWTALPNVTWISPIPTSSSGTGKVQFVVAPNNGPGRSGSISVGGKQFNIDQAGLSCSFVLSPATAAFNDTGGSALVVVTTSSTCSWNVTSNAGWLTTSSSTGKGKSTILITAASNTGGPRSGTVTIAGQTFSATQGAGACGAVDITSETSVHRSSLTPIALPAALYSQNITVSNGTNSTIPGPIYIALIGMPTHNGYPNDVFLNGNQQITHCFSSLGDYLLIVSGSLSPAQSVTLPLVWIADSPFVPIVYTTKVLSGIAPH